MRQGDSLSLADLEALLDTHTPRWRAQSRIIALEEHEITVEMVAGAPFVRSEQAMMALADRAAYYLTLATGGAVPSAVTTDLAIHFLADANAGELRATATLLRIGRNIAVTIVEICAGAVLAARATVTYALPSGAGTHDASRRDRHV